MMKNAIRLFRLRFLSAALVAIGTLSATPDHTSLAGEHSAASKPSREAVAGIGPKGRPLIIYVEPVRADLDGYTFFVDDHLHGIAANGLAGVTVVRWPDRTDQPPKTWTGEKLETEFMSHVVALLGDASASLGPTEFQAGLEYCTKLGGPKAEILIISANTALFDFPETQQRAVKDAAAKQTVDVLWYGPAPVALKTLVSGYAVTVERGTAGLSEQRDNARGSSEKERKLKER